VFEKVDLVQKHSRICGVTFALLLNLHDFTFHHLPTPSFSLPTLRPCLLTLR